MRSAVVFVLMASALFFAPTLLTEEFEAAKVMVLVSFALFSLLIVDWKLLGFDQVAQCLFLFAFSAFESAMYSIDPHMSFFGNPKSPNGLAVTASYLVFYLACRRYRDEKAIYFVIAAAVGVAGYAIAQVSGHDFMVWYGTLTAAGYTRPPSTLGHPNFMAGYLAMVLPFLLWRAEIGGRVEKLTMLGAASLLVAAILFSQSRGMWLAAIGAVAVYFWVSGANVKRFITSALAAGCVIGIVAATVPSFRESALDRMENLLSPGPARLEYPKGAIRIWKRYPFLGAGTDAFEIAFQHQRTPYYWEIEPAGSPHRAHNEFLNILATQGLFGAVVALALTAAVALRARASTVAMKPALLAAIAAFYIESLTSFTVAATGTLFIYCLALL